MKLKLTKDKNLFIEQLRGIAILLVVAFHYTDRIPYETLGSDTPPHLVFEHGFLGVYIFFILSGFLIAKTMRNSATLSEFNAKRVSRIWPLFIVSNVVVFLWVKMLPTPVVVADVRGFDVTGRGIDDLLGTSFFLKDFGFEWIDGVHWSILVEMKYYFIVGIFAVLFKQRYVNAFTTLALVIGILEFGSILFFGNGEYTIFNKLLHGLLISQYLVFFAVGMRIYQKKFDLLMFSCILLIFAQSILATMNNPDFHLDSLIGFCLFLTLFLMTDHFVFSGKISKFFGYYSYAIYLFHQAIGLSLIFLLTPVVGINFAILLALLGVIAISIALSEFFEWKYRIRTTELLIQIGNYVGLRKLKLPQ